MSRGGWTLHEMLISLVVMSAVMAMAAQLSAGQMRFFRSSAELATMRGEARQATAIAASMLRSLSPQGGDVQVALDSAIQIHAATGAAVVCSSSEGTITIPPVAGATGNTVAAFSALPEAGDRVFALHADSLGDWWSTHVITETGSSSSACAAVPQLTAARWIRFEDSAILSPGTALRFARPFRLSLYRSSDGRWHLGVRDWNAESGRFNTIQPVAGPLAAYDADAARSGLTFMYSDATGAALSLDADRNRIAVITVVARVRSGDLADSSAVVIALRNGR